MDVRYPSASGNLTSLYRGRDRSPSATKRPSLTWILLRTKSTVESATASIFTQAAVDGALKLLWGGQVSGVPNAGEAIAKKAVEKAGSDLLKDYALKAIKGGGKKMAEDGIKGLVKQLQDPNASTTTEEILKAGAESFLEGAGMAILGPIAEKYAKGASNYITASDLKKYLGKLDYEKVLAEGLKTALEKAGSAAVKKILSGWTPERNHSAFEKEVKASIVEDAGVQAAIKKAAEKEKKSK